MRVRRVFPSILAAFAAITLGNVGAEVDQVDGTLYYNSKLEGTKVGIARFKQS